MKEAYTWDMEKAENFQFRPLKFAPDSIEDLHFKKSIKNPSKYETYSNQVINNTSVTF